MLRISIVNQIVENAINIGDVLAAKDIIAIAKYEERIDKVNNPEDAITTIPRREYIEDKEA